jgi:RNA polymerase sigma factor (sigma-70 family)
MNVARPAEVLRQLERAAGAPTPDAELLARFAASRDAEAFAELVRRHGPLVLGVCRRVTGHPQDAEDAFQATFLVLAKKAGALRNPALLGNWLYGVAFRVASRAKRAAGRRRAWEVTVSVLPEPPAPASVPALPELASVLDQELAALPACYRDAVVLCDVRGVSREAAAAVLGIPEGTLSSRLANGRKKLAARLTKRGVALTAAAVPLAVAEVQAGTVVPNDLLTKTCGLVADWAAGALVLGSLIRLSEGGFPVRKMLMLGAVMVVGVAGAVLAARPGDPPQADPPKPPAVAEKSGLPQPEAEPKPAPGPKPEDKPTFATPKLRATTDIGMDSVQQVAWSKDGRFVAIDGRLQEPTKGENALGLATKSAKVRVLLGFHENKFYHLQSGDPRDGSAPTKDGSDLVGFTADSRHLITSKREYHLVSGLHWLRYESLPDDIPGAPGGFYKSQSRTVDLDSTDTYGYAFAPDGRTFRTCEVVPDPSGGVTAVEMYEVSAVTGKTLKKLARVEASGYALSADGTRVAVIDKTASAVTAYDTDRGEMVTREMFRIDKEVESRRILQDKNGPIKSQPPPAVAISPDGKRVVVARLVGQTFVLNVETGAVLPTLEHTATARLTPQPGCFTADGRFFAAEGTSYRLDVRSGKSGFGGFGGEAKEEKFWTAEKSFTGLWDTQTGKALKTWNKSVRVAVHPVKPLVAILERNGDHQYRVGLWDFSAEAEKK